MSSPQSFLQGGGGREEGKKEERRKEGREGRREGEIWFIHSFKSDVKIPENISNYFSYSLGQDIRPSIFIKAPIGQKYL